MSQLNQLRNRGVISALDRVIVWAILFVSVLAGLFGLVRGGVIVSSEVASGEISLALIANQPLPAKADIGTPRIVAGSYATADVTVSGLSFGVSSLAIATQIVNTLTQAAIAASIAFLAWRVLRARPFTRSLSLTVMFAGSALLVGGLFSQGFGSVAAAMAAGELNGPTARGFWPLAGRIDGTPLAFGVVLLLVGVAFEYGERLQRDTEGLV